MQHWQHYGAVFKPQHAAHAGLINPNNFVTGVQLGSSVFSITCAPVVASSGFLSSLMRRNRGKRREIPFSGST